MKVAIPNSKTFVLETLCFNCLRAIEAKNWCIRKSHYSHALQENLDIHVLEIDIAISH